MAFIDTSQGDPESLTGGSMTPGEISFGYNFALEMW
jgi:hypothetical protein